MNTFCRSSRTILVALILGVTCQADTSAQIVAVAGSQAINRAASDTADSITGAYRAGVLNLELNEDGSFRFGYQPGWIAFGTFAVDGQAITFIDEKGAQACPPDVAGKYSYAYSNGRLLLEVVADACVFRKTMMTYTAFHRAEFSRFWWDDQMDHPAN